MLYAIYVSLNALKVMRLRGLNVVQLFSKVLRVISTTNV